MSARVAVGAIVQGVIGIITAVGRAGDAHVGTVLRAARATEFSLEQAGWGSVSLVGGVPEGGWGQVGEGEDGELGIHLDVEFLSLCWVGHQT